MLGVNYHMSEMIVHNDDKGSPNGGPAIQIWSNIVCFLSLIYNEYFMRSLIQKINIHYSRELKWTREMAIHPLSTQDLQWPIACLKGT